MFNFFKNKEKKEEPVEIPLLIQELLKLEFEEWELDTLYSGEGSEKNSCKLFILECLGVVFVHKQGFELHYSLGLFHITYRGVRGGKLVSVKDSGWNELSDLHSRLVKKFQVKFGGE